MTAQRTTGKPGGPAWWALMGASAGAVAFIGTVAGIGAAWERLRYGKHPHDTHPGEPRVYASSVFRSMDERRDG